jgi:hypothetical protein
MENASKALIIAGAILLSILIIALGIYVFNMAKSTINQNSLTDLEVQQFNEKFQTYEGKIIGSNLKTLLDKVITNAVECADDADKLPDIVYLDPNKKGPVFTIGSSSQDDSGITIVSDVTNTNRENISTLRSKISSSHYYQVDFSTSNDTGLINLITITY